MLFILHVENYLLTSFLEYNLDAPAGVIHEEIQTGFRLAVAYFASYPQGHGFF